MDDKSNLIRYALDLSPNIKPIGLQSLQSNDPDVRPPYSNVDLVKHAILGSPRQKLTLSEIYDAISSRFPWFQTAGDGWKNSVRHCLSLDTQFRKEPRPFMEPGKGCYWSVLDTPRGNKRERKRNRKPTKLVPEVAHIHSEPPTSFPLTTPAFRDYATTVPAPPSSSQLGVIPSHLHPPTQSGWTSYTSAAEQMSTSQLDSVPSNSTSSADETEHSKREKETSSPSASYDYATTIPAPSGTVHMRPHSPAQSGWIPYFPVTADSPPMPTALRYRRYNEVPVSTALVHDHEVPPSTSSTEKNVQGWGENLKRE